MFGVSVSFAHSHAHSSTHKYTNAQRVVVLYTLQPQSLASSVCLSLSLSALCAPFLFSKIFRSNKTTREKQHVHENYISFLIAAFSRCCCPLCVCVCAERTIVFRHRKPLYAFWVSIISNMSTQNQYSSQNGKAELRASSTSGWRVIEFYYWMLSSLYAVTVNTPIKFYRRRVNSLRARISSSGTDTLLRTINAYALTSVPDKRWLPQFFFSFVRSFSFDLEPEWCALIPARTRNLHYFFFAEIRLHVVVVGVRFVFPAIAGCFSTRRDSSFVSSSDWNDTHTISQNNACANGNSFHLLQFVICLECHLDALKYHQRHTDIVRCAATHKYE